MTTGRLAALTFVLASATFWANLSALGCENTCVGVQAVVGDLWIPLAAATIVSLIATAVSGVRRLRSRSQRH